MNNEPKIHLYSPFPNLISPHAVQLQADINHWISQFTLVSAADAAKFATGHFGWLTARAYPWAAYDRLQMIARCMVWTFANDDHHDQLDAAELAALHGRFLAVLDGATPTSDDSSQCGLLAVLRDQLQAVAPSGWMERFIQSVDDYLAGTRWEAPLRISAAVPDLATYLEMRQYTIAVYLFTNLIEVANNLTLSVEVIEHPIIKRLIYLCNAVISWCNDLYSYQKERDGEVMNLVFVLQAEYGLSLAAAVTQAIAIHDADVREFVALKQQIPHFDPVTDIQVQQYVHNLETWMRGHITWYEVDTQRYGKNHDVFAIRNALIAA